MLSKRHVATVALAATIALATTTGCQGKPSTPDFTDKRRIADLTTLTCYYHNVAKMDQASDFPFGFGNIGAKRMWFEYGGTVTLGIDVDKVEISGPDENGVVTVTIPKAELQGDPQIDESSISEPVTELGLFTGITAEEKTAPLRKAQQNMAEETANDTVLLTQAQERAKEILENYVVNVGEAIGQDYTVKFVDAEE